MQLVRILKRGTDLGMVRDGPQFKTDTDVYVHMM